ncbi:Protein humpback-2 [Toxocara canis]|uniref:Protein humpback-2 n=1 Tax=Toxocara canis TaxID=6265 RepID=A0A0B2VSI3_TOXCA|nr:Protein humpback-2 [Toxocara canis]
MLGRVKLKGLVGFVPKGGMDENACYNTYGSQSHSLYEGDANALFFRFKEMGESYVQSRSDRIRAAMFPEMCSEEVQGGEMFENRSCIVERLAEPSQLLKTAVIELLSVQDESEIATKAIPELVKLLSDKDETVVLRAAHMVHLLSKEDKSMAAIAANPALTVVLRAAHMVHLLSKEDKSMAAIAANPALVAALCSVTRFENETIRKDALAALSHISEHAEGRMHLFRSGGIPELVRMLGVPVDAVRHYAITTIHNLLLYMESAKQETRACGGLEAMTPLLREKNPRFLALLVDSLYLLVLDHPQSKLSFLSLSGPSLLFALLDSHRSYPKLVYTVVRCIRAISVCPQNKAALISLGALQILGDFIEGVDERTQFAVLCAVRNLSDAATNEDNLGPLIVRLIGIVTAGEETSTACAAGVLSNLTCNNVRNKQTLCANRGMEVLCCALERFSGVEEITEPALCALRHCTARHSLAAQAQSDVRLAHTLPVILELLCTMRAPVVKAALGLVRNLALLPANLQSLVHETTAKGESVVSLTMDVLARAGAQLRQDPEAVADGVAMRELVEGAVSALHQLANAPQVAATMLRDHPFIDMIIKLLSWEEVYANEDELLQRELLGLLYQLSKTPEGARQLDMYGPTPVLADALHSKHKAISTYASGVLKNLQFDKPMVYREELDTEIESAISGGEEWMHDGLEPELFAEMYQSPGVDRLDQHAPWQPPPYQANNPNPSWFDTDL